MTHTLPPAQPAPEVTLQQAASAWAGRTVEADEVSGRVDSNARAELRPYTVELIDRRGKRSRYTEYARSLTAAYWSAINQHGRACVATVKPIRTAP